MCNPCFQGVEPADTNCRPTRKQIQGLRANKSSAQTLFRYIELSIKAPGRDNQSKPLVHSCGSAAGAYNAHNSLSPSLEHLGLLTLSQGVSFSSLALRSSQHSVRKRIHKIPSQSVVVLKL